MEQCRVCTVPYTTDACRDQLSSIHLKHLKARLWAKGNSHYSSFTETSKCMPMGFGIWIQIPLITLIQNQIVYCIDKQAANIGTSLRISVIYVKHTTGLEQGRQKHLNLHPRSQSVPSLSFWLSFLSPRSMFTVCFVSDPHLQTRYLVISVWRQHNMHLRMGLSVRILIRVIFGHDGVGHQDVVEFVIVAGGYTLCSGRHELALAWTITQDTQGLTLQVTIQGVTWD